MARRRASSGDASASSSVDSEPISSVDPWARQLLALYSAQTLPRFIDEAFRAVRRVIPCDYVSVFYKRGAKGFLKERDSRGRIWSPAFMRRYVELTPAIPLVAANPGVKVLATRSTLPLSDAELKVTPFFREIMRPQGWRHGAVLCFWSVPLGSFPILVLTVYRSEGRADFTEADLEQLESVHTFLAPAVERFHQLSASTAVTNGMAMALRRRSRAVMVLDWQLRIVHTSVAARRRCAEWGRRTSEVGCSGAAGFPEDLLQVCSELLEGLSAIRQLDAACTTSRRRTVVNPLTPDLIATITIVCEATPIAEPSFVVEFAVHRRSAASAQPSPLSRLTRCEREVAMIVSEGLSNEETAERLGKSIHAVKFTLHRVYRKLDVSNRARLSLLMRGLRAS